MKSFKEFVSEDAKEFTHQVVHNKTGNVVGKYTSLKAAQRAADKKDSAYGAVAHIVKPIAIKEDGMGAGAAVPGPTNVTGAQSGTDPASASAVDNRDKKHRGPKNNPMLFTKPETRKPPM